MLLSTNLSLLRFRYTCHIHHPFNRNQINRNHRITDTQTQRGSLYPMHLSPTLKYVSSTTVMHAYRGFRINSSRIPTTVPSPSRVWPICVGIFLPGGRHRAASSIISGPLIKSGARQIAKFNGVIRVSEANCDTSCNVDITWRSMRRVDDDNPGRRISLILIISSRLTDYTD